MKESCPSGWVDLASPSHPFLFRGLVNRIPDYSISVTTRNKTETVKLADEAGFTHKTIGRDYKNTFLRKIGIPLRTLQLAKQAPPADFSLSARNAMCILSSKYRNMPSIHFTDNDITAYRDGLFYENLYNCIESMATYNIVPSAFKNSELIKWGADPRNILSYDGYKEDIYVADFEPDSDFTDILPFEEYIVIRPEALGAVYINTESSLVPNLLAKAVNHGFNVVYLPRGRGDIQVGKKYPENRVYIPTESLNGLQLEWHSQGVLTGSGTMAREAACLGVPAISFFPETPLSVDQELIDKGKIFWSRDVEEIIAYLQSVDGKRISFNRQRSQRVQREVANHVLNAIDREL